MGRSIATICLLACLLCGRAMAYDPLLEWKTIETTHFEIHFHTGTRQLAARVATLAEKALAQVAGGLEHQPAGRIQLVISDDNDSANGSAGVLPYNQVNLLSSPPEDLSVLNDYDDYLWILLVHELTHIVHMDTVSGLPRIINLVFGRTAFPNGAQPGWFTEGLAVHLESALSTAGRIRSSLFRMYLRTAALAGTIPTIDQLSGLMKDWPQGTAPYLYGSFFIDYLARRFGETALTDLSHKMSGMLVPWTLNIVARAVLGLDYPTLYRQWTDSVRARARRTLRRLEGDGLTPFRLLTRRGQYQGHPRVSSGSGQVLYYSSPTDDWPTLRLVDRRGRNDRQLAEVNSDGGASFLPDESGVVFSQSEVVDQFYAVYDLYLLDLESGRVRRLSDSLRARSPDVSPDGRRIAFVRNMAGRTSIMTTILRRAPGAIDRPRMLVEYQDGSQVYSPRFSPDGRRLVFSVAPPGGGRNIVLADLESGALLKLSDGRFMDCDPVFSADGRSIIFSSDRTGIYNIWQLNLQNLSLARITNLASGAFSPDPAADGSGLAFLVYGPYGYDVAWLGDLSGRFSTSATRPARPPPPSMPTKPMPKVSSYTPWSTIWPRAWWPVLGSDQWGNTYGLMLSGRDALGKLDYKLELDYGSGHNQLYFDLGVTARVVYPTLYLYVGRHVDRYYNQALVNDRILAVDKERLTIYGDVFFPFSSLRQSHGIFFNYELRMYDRWTRIPRDPGDPEPLLPDDGNLAWLGLGWSFSNVRWYTHSISAEKGFSTSLSLRYSHPELGSGSSLIEARFWLRSYFSIWRSHHHVLALGLQGGIVMGDQRRKWVYALGGLPIDDVFLDAYYGYRYGGLYLRGYPQTAFMGSIFTLGSMEYRFPIVDIEKGVLTLPFYLRRLHAAVFVDVGGTAIDTPSLEMLKVGVGAELRLDMLLAYYLSATLRLGYARGLSEGGGNNIFLTMGWGF